MPSGKKSDSLRDRAALGLAVGGTVQAVAGLCEVSERTIFNWLAEPEFKARIDALRAELLARAMGNVAARMVRASEVLGQLLESGNEHIRLGAARTLLQEGVKLRDSVQLAAAVAELQAENQEIKRRLT